MYEIFTYGRFEVPPENEDAFIQAWSEFASWTSNSPGDPRIRLARDVRNPGRFVSIGRWEDAEAVRAWKSSDEFKQRLGRLVNLATDFEPTELAVLRRVEGVQLETLTPPADLQPIDAPT